MTEDFMMARQSPRQCQCERGILNILTADLRLALVARSTRYDHNYQHLFPGIQIFSTNKKICFLYKKFGKIKY